eukprot:CAMPEP_0118664696 /NCGR_PEP_ID=MMETSP0785-20121206/18173_1 /TAXON_ID=91992 /ORGANISM="Bolidomonas pacifica, Strain CCMP 1866" /LENGTH=341 /DNA_ID=CAMNT_0006558665 /DNA_START=158 /DNA_END=1180 /DNA_ORIENTATION=-
METPTSVQNQSLGSVSSFLPLGPELGYSVNMCELNHAFATQILKVSFNTCASDCVGSTMTDVAIALHAAYMAYNIWRARPKMNGISFTLASYVLVNSIWSLEGSLFWLQPSGEKLPWFLDEKYFDFLWKLNAQFEAVLLFLFWKLAISLLETADLLHPSLKDKKSGMLFMAVIYAASFSIVTVKSCVFENFILFGASNILPPLCSSWLSLMYISYYYWPHLTYGASEGITSYRPTGSAKFLRFHPIVLGVLSGAGYWIGNTGIIFGTDSFFVYWSRELLSFIFRRRVTRNEWEEMAFFHLGTLVGNEILFRCWCWIAAAEAQIEGKNGKLKSRTWLKDVLL